MNAAKKNLAALTANLFVLEQEMLNAKRAGNAGEVLACKNAIRDTQARCDALAAKLGW